MPDPNSANQRWSYWSYRVYPSNQTLPPFQLVKETCARFGGLMFGSASEMNVSQATDAKGQMYWEVEVRTEGHPVHDPKYLEWMTSTWCEFLRSGFGQGSRISMTTKMLAGSRQDGTPADQWIHLPELVSGVRVGPERPTEKR